MAFLEFCAFILLFVVITQVIMPIFAPNSFDYFWLFRKDKKVSDNTDDKKENTGDDLRKAIKEAVGIKKKADKTINDVSKKTKANLKNAQNLDNEIEGLK